MDINSTSPRHAEHPVDVDAIDLLTADHRLVRGWFAQIDQARQASLAADRHRKGELIEQLCTELEIHTRIEEEIFYPAVRAAFQESEDEMIDHAIHEHQEAKDIMQKLRGLPAEDPRADELVDALRKAVEHHLHEEEERMFTEARSRIDGMAVGRQLAQQKRALSEQMIGKC